MPRRHSFRPHFVLAAALAVVVASTSCGGESRTPLEPTPISVDVAGTWIGEYREVRCEVNGQACAPTRQGLIRLEIPLHGAPPTSISGAVGLSECTLLRQLTFSSERVSGMLQPDALSLAGEARVSLGPTTRTSSAMVETTIAGTREMQGRFIKNVLTVGSTRDLGSRVQEIHEYEFQRMTRQNGDLPLCSRPGGEMPPPGPIEPPREDSDDG